MFLAEKAAIGFFYCLLPFIFYLHGCSSDNLNDEIYAELGNGCGAALVTRRQI